MLRVDTNTDEKVARRLRTQMLETVAEVFLLSEADAIVHGLSRYATVASWLCSSCMVEMMVQLDIRCGRRSSVRDQPCVGAGKRYLAQDLMAANHSESGKLESGDTKVGLKCS